MFDRGNEDARLTPESYPVSPWTQFRELYVLGVARF